MEATVSPRLLGLALIPRQPPVSGASFLFLGFLWGLTVSMVTGCGASLLAGLWVLVPAQGHQASSPAPGRPRLYRVTWQASP